MRSPRKLPLPFAALVMAASPVFAIISDGSVHAESAPEDAVGGDVPTDPSACDGETTPPGVAPADGDACAGGVPIAPAVNEPAPAPPAVTVPSEGPTVEATVDSTVPGDPIPAEDPTTETTPPETTVPVDTTTPETTVPVDTTTPETTVPVDTTTPETTVPVDTTTPETTVGIDTTPVETTVPVDATPVDTTTPETTVPVDTTPVDTTTPETIIPVDTTPAQPGAIDEPVAAPAESVADVAERGDVVEFDRGAHIPPAIVDDASTATSIADAVDPQIVPPPDTTDGPNQPEVRPNLIASNYDGVYADGVPVGVALSTTRWLESRGDYNAQARGSSASGAYQIIDSTWNGYGGYARAVDAPPAIQDQFAYEQFVSILKRHGNDVSKIPITWYYPLALSNPAWMDQIPAPSAGNVFTVREYQTVWMEKFYELLGEGAPVFLPADLDPLIPSIAFPVLGPVSFVNDWHYARAGGARVHEGLDFMGSYNQPLRAAFNGEIVRLVRHNSGISGVSIEIRREDGTRAIYRHVNNDTPGTTDDSAIQAFRIHPGIDVGSTVRAGQIIGFMGDTGNAQGLPHLHFELRTDDRTPFAPYPAVIQAQQREQCSVGIGPWSTQFESPTELAESFTALTAMAPEDVALLTVDDLRGLTSDQLDQVEGVTVETRDALDAIVAPIPFEVSGPDGALWQIGADGTVLANGIGALIAPTQGDCSVLPDEFTWYGTDGAGLPIDLLPSGWWGDEVPTEPIHMTVRRAEALAARLAEEDENFAGHVHDADEPAHVEPIGFVAANAVSFGIFDAR